MSFCVQPEPLYQSVFGQSGSIYPSNVIISCVIFTVQLAIIIFFIVIGCQQNKISPKQSTNKSQHQKPEPNQFLGHGYRVDLEPNQQPDNQPQSQRKQKCQKFFNLESSIINFFSPTYRKLIVISIIYGLIAALTITFLFLSVVSAWQGTNNRYQYGQCILNESLSNITNGNQQFIGLQNIQSNISKLDLVAKSRISVAKNAVKSLILNGTANLIKPGIGFANNSVIPIITNQSANTHPTVLANSVKLYIDSALRQWLKRNSSLSGSYKFPICQSRSILIPHPINDNDTVQMTYVSNICSALTNQVNNIASNGAAIDDLFTRLQAAQANLQNIRSNLSNYQQIYSNVSGKGLQLANKNSLGYNSNNDTIKAITLLNLLLYLIFFFTSIAYFTYLYCLLQQNNQKHKNQSNQQINKHQQDDKDNRSKKSSRVLLIFNTLIIVSIGASSFYISEMSSLANNNCQLGKQSLTDTATFQSLNLNQQSSLFKQMHLCTAGINSIFMVEPTTVTNNNLNQINRLSTLSSTYNNTTPASIFTSQSFTQIQVFKDYLLNIGTIPLLGNNFLQNETVSKAIQQLQLYSNGNDSIKEQVVQCGSSITKDQYVFNAFDCLHQLMNVSNPADHLTTEPRCIQIPTFNGSGGTSAGALNQVQHNIILNTTCNSVQKVFDSSISGCFIANRLNLFNSNCPQIGTEYARRVKNLVIFSVEVGKYTDVYMQNLRNFFGVYAVLNSNLTQFFNGKNMTSIMNDFGTLSSNLIDKASCSFINSTVKSIIDSYCPQINSISQLLYQSTIWCIVALCLFPIQAISFYILDITIRWIPVTQKEVQLPKLSTHKPFEITQQDIMHIQLDRPQINDHLNNNDLFQKKENFKDQSQYGSHETYENKHIQQRPTIKKQQRMKNIFDSDTHQYEPRQIQSFDQSKLNLLKFQQNQRYLPKIQRKLPPTFFNYKNYEESEESIESVKFQKEIFKPDTQVVVAVKKGQRLKDYLKANQTQQLIQKGLQRIKRQKNNSKDL